VTVGGLLDSFKMEAMIKTWERREDLEIKLITNHANVMKPP
jgi:hypothetical protein